MSIALSPLTSHDNGYPTSDGKPMAETDWHRDLMLLLIEVLRAFYAGKRVYVSGNLLVFYEEGNRRRHVSPDVWLARGVENRQRPNYLIWEEPRGPEFIIELTSSSTRDEDQRTKFALYRDTPKVREYFLFDPFGDYLDPPLQGYRLRGGRYVRIRPRNGRLPSQVLGLHLERDGDRLRVWDPTSGAWLPTLREATERAEHRAEQAAQRAHQAEQHAIQAERLAEQAVNRAKAEAELGRLRQELERLREQRNGQG
jgi:Uma2 family endonuclease